MKNEGIHIVVSKDEEYIYLITAYYPDDTRWEIDLKTRKRCLICCVWNVVPEQKKELLQM
jgi:hypothetical protein